MPETSTSDLACVHIWLMGRVQGVGFRAFVLQAATTLGLTGWVRNLGYDQVETLAEGPRLVLEEFSSMLRAGPSVSRVDEARVVWESPQREFHSFNVR